eukprot:12044422-Heterocapsa_arctica.AAC.1
MNDYLAKQYRPAQHQHSLEHFSSLEYLQVLSGQNCSRLPNLVNSEKHSRDRLRRDQANRERNNMQKEGRTNKLGKTLYMIGEASNPGPDSNSIRKQ